MEVVGTAGVGIGVPGEAVARSTTPGGARESRTGEVGPPPHHGWANAAARRE